MGRTFTNTAQISKGFEMYAKGYRRSSILDSFSDEPRPSLRTLGNWIARYKNVSEDILALEHEFEWVHMDMFSIPWEHAQLINRLSCLELQKPSLRRVRWWFRIKEINPHYSDGVVAYIANKCVVNEHMDLMEIPGSDWSHLLESTLIEDEEHLELLPGTFAICFFELGTILPNWVQNGVFLSITRTESNISVVCSDKLIPDEENISRGWNCLKYEGDQALWRSLVSRIASPHHLQFLSLGDSNYLLLKNLGDIEQLGLKLKRMVND